MEKMDTDVWVQRVKDCYLNFASVYYHFQILFLVFIESRYGVSWRASSVPLFDCISDAYGSYFYIYDTSN